MTHLDNIPHQKIIKVEVEQDLLKLVNKHVESVNGLTELVDCVPDSISEPFKEVLREEGKVSVTTDLVDLVCSAEEGDIQTMLYAVLAHHPKALHQFITTEQANIKLAMIESAQALLTGLEGCI